MIDTKRIEWLLWRCCTMGHRGRYMWVNCADNAMFDAEWWTGLDSVCTELVRECVQNDVQITKTVQRME